MRAVIQRVSRASVEVGGEVVGKIDRGFLVFLGVGNGDNEKDADYLVKKICGMRIFSDENDRINLGLKDVGGEMLVVSQFTLYADTKKGNRPSFIEAADPETANRLYEYFVSECKKVVAKVEKGIFGEDMQVELLNDGPFTIILESLC